MTSITLNVTGARIQATVNGPLTSGMAGIPVTIHYDEVWNGLIKNLVCRYGKWGPDKGDTRTVLNIGETTTVAHEIMQADMHLYLGIEGYSADGKLVIPTTWADCGMILHGANAGEDLSADPKLSIWTQLQAEIEKIKQEPVAEEKIAAAVAAYLEENPIEGSDFTQNVKLTADQISALDGMFKVCAFIKEDLSAEYNVFKTAFGITDSGDSGNGDSGETEKTLTRISAVYSGGSVAVGTAVTALTGIVVTAHYSDGTSKTVTGYTLSGTIAEGENTITVSFSGMTTTFAVTGTAESGGEETEVSNETTWTNGVSYTGITWEADKYLHASTGEVKTDDGWGLTQFLYCEGAAKIHIANTYSAGGNYSGFFDANKVWISSFCGTQRDAYVTVPANAAYFRLATDMTGVVTITPYANA